MEMIPAMTQRSFVGAETSESHINVWALCVAARHRHPFERGPESLSIGERMSWAQPIQVDSVTELR